MRPARAADVSEAPALGHWQWHEIVLVALLVCAVALSVGKAWPLPERMFWPRATLCICEWRSHAGTTAPQKALI